MALRPALSNGLPFSSIKYFIAFPMERHTYQHRGIIT